MIKKINGCGSRGDIDLISVEVLNESNIDKCVENELKNIDVDNVDVIVEKNLSSDVCVLCISDEDFIILIDEKSKYFNKVNGNEDEDYEVVEELLSNCYDEEE